MNNLLSRAAIIYLCVSLFLYLGVSFVSLSFNPADWEEGLRIAIWFASVVCTFFLCTFFLIPFGPFMKDMSDD